jgi:hypothetical protein
MFIRHKSVVATILTMLCVPLVGATWATTAGEVGAEAGTWQPHQYTFNFFGFTTTYSCDGLEDKLRLLLKMVGAGQNFKVVAPCTLGSGRPDRLAQAYLTFSSLQPAPSADNAGVGEWRHVAISPRHPFEFDYGDCELIEQFRFKVLPLFAVRNLKDDVRCVPNQESGSNYNLSFDVFAPPIPPKTAPKKS